MRGALAHTVTGSQARWIYQTICYFDIFSFPLKKEEILRFCPRKISDAGLDESLNELLALGKISKIRDYYFLLGASEQNLHKRLANEIYLAGKMSRIKKYARLISRFPFVESCFISGSVSKGVLNPEGDVDFFIIARSGRVWLCRTLLVAFKKIALFNSRKYFCVNYFVDTGNLRVPDDNLFVATEIATLLPVTENECSRKFAEANQWAWAHFPNYGAGNRPLLEHSAKSFVPRFLEKALSGAAGEWLDDFFFRMTLRRWRRKFPFFEQKEFDLNMRSYKNVSKHHPQGHQQKVLGALESRMRDFG